MTWWQRLRHRDRLERELDAELRYHFDREVEDNVRAGMSEQEAHRLARLDFGGDDQLKESCRDARGTRWAGDITQDLRFAARLLLRDRWFTLAAAIALALGIGMNGTMFTIVNAMIRGLPIDSPDRIMSINARDGAGRQLGVSYRDFLDWRVATKTLSGLAAFSQTTTTLGDDGRAPERASACYLSANTFRLLGETPTIGRDFLPEDDQPGAAPVVILGSRIWKARYNADPTLIGRTVRVNGVPSIVIAVMPDGFSFPVISDVWQPLGLVPGLTNQRRDTRALQVLGKLADRSTPAQAQAEAETIAARLSRDYPDTNGNIGAVVARFPPHFAPDRILDALMGAVGFVLLVACANVANLLLARSAGRSREISIRVSLGATRWRIVRQLLVESGLLAGIAGAFGFVFSLAGVWLFSTAVAGINFPYYIQWTIDGRVLRFVAAVCLGTGFLVGLPPALQVSKTAANRSLKEGGRTTTSGVGRRRWTTGLLIAELALTLVLLAGAALMMRSFLAVYRADLVVDATHVVAMPLTLPNQKYHTPEQRKAFYQRVAERVGAIPGVSSAAFANAVPFAGGPSRQLAIDGRPLLTDEPQPTVSYVTIRGRYFETLGLRLLRGRTFIDTDDVPGHESVIVNQRFVTMFFPNEDPIGRRIRLTAAAQDIRREAPTLNTPVSVPPAWATIVGISPTVRQQYFQDLDPVVYVPNRADAAGTTLIVRGQSAPAAITPSIRAGVYALDQDVAVNAIRPLEELMTGSRWGHRVFGGMLTVFAFVALALAAVGLYAVTAYSVVRRTQEIGVRMALGAQAASVVWLFAKRTMLPLGTGLGIGLAGALGVGRLLEGFLIQTSPTDPMTLAGIAVLLTAVSSAACFVPARRATRLDPVAALRYE
jgi:putative ABC transport system permease protein